MELTEQNEDIRFRTQQRTTLSFTDVSFVVGRGLKAKTILQQVGAEVTEGHVLAIMGPSGAGKSTLISILTQNAHYGDAFGRVMLNNSQMNNAVFKQYCYVVEQKDSNWPYLTVREILNFALELYNTTKTRSQLTKRVDQVLTKVGLASVANVRGIHLSGGQQRRLSLAVALLKQPKVLFLDEPTSGLDAASASAIMREITAVARKEHLIIVCTIHQPSSKVFNDFDQVMLLSRGREAYVGNAQDSIDYFESIGYPLPPATNGAEHLLDVVNADFSTDTEVEAVIDAWTKRRDHDDASPYQGLLPAPVGGGQVAHTLFNETVIMLRRVLLLFYRDPILYVGRLIGFLLVNCVFGIVYIAGRKYIQGQAINKLWVAGWFIGVPANMAVINTYKANLELKAIFREHKNGMGSVASYLIAKTIVSIPIMFAFAIAALGVPAFVIQNYPMSTFLPHILLWTVQIFVWEASSEAMAALFDEVVLGMLFHTTWWFTALLFSGYLVPLEDLFWPLKLFYYILPYNYYIRSSLYLLFTNADWPACTDPFSSAVCVDSTDGLDVLSAMETIFQLIDTESTYVVDTLCMLGIALTWKVFGTIVILRKAQRGAPVLDPRGAPKDSRPTTKQTPVESELDFFVRQKPQVVTDGSILFSSSKPPRNAKITYEESTDFVVDC